MTTSVTITDHELPDETHNLYTVTVSVAGDPAPSSPTTFTCLLTNSPTHLTDWLAALPLPPPGPTKTIVGLDVEWRPNRSPRDDHPIATLQLHLLETHSVVFQILHSPTIPEALTEFLNDERLVFVGVGIEEDIEKLVCDYGVSMKAEVRDLRTGEGTKGLGLTGLAKRVLGMDVVKNKRVGMSRWDMFWLNSDQVKYACFDAFLSWKIGEALLNDDARLDWSKPLVAFFAVGEA
ncbi:hypothetical protein MLD38_025967 [Melastoma candidum]|uniref:Uncharacterized protein n=1 Tax=Melastoma candidum TaxID=119954 RepID=A0ACB9NYW0_9MYRT|nr:hypothetical protein MLD38_025967 [Melastoma candidum]